MTHYFNYIGIDASGKHVQGHFEASDIPALYNHLSNQHIYVISAQVMPRLHMLKSYLNRLAITSKSIQDWCFQLNLLLTSGIVVADAIEFIIDQKLSPPMMVISQQTQIKLSQGQTLSSILKNFSYCFDNVFISLIQMGEKTGSLIQSLQHLLLYLNWQQKLKEQLLRAMIYPLLLLMMTSVLLGVLFIVLIPQMQQLLIQYQQELPLATKLLIALSEFSTAYTATIITGILGLYVILKIVTGYSLKFKITVDRLKFTYPLIGNLLYMIEAERFTFTFKTLYKSGVDIIDCLEQAECSIKNIWLKSKVQMVTARIIKGEMLSQALIVEGVFDDYLSKIIVVGEKSGHLGDALDHASQFYMQKLQRRFDTISAAIGPSFILIIGMILVWIALAMFAPIYDHLTVIL